ncbi:MAG: hypothetical protein ACP5SI_01335 [Chloroflexia bacterium]
MDWAQIAGMWIAALLTLAVYSVLVGRNPLFRLAQYLFLGTALGYAVLVVLNRFLIPTVQRVIAPQQGVDPVSRGMTLLGLLWGVLLAAWLFRPIRWLASWPLAVAFGVGSALAVGGALMGTLIPQVGATILPLRGAGAVDNLIVVLVVLLGLASLFWTVRREGKPGKALGGIARVGRWALLVALGAFLGARAISLLNAVVERLHFLGQWLGTLLP